MGGSGSFPPPNNCNHYLGGRWVYSNTNNTCPVSITITSHLLLYMFYIFKFVSQLKIKNKKINLFFYSSLFFFVLLYLFIFIFFGGFFWYLYITSSFFWVFYFILFFPFSNTSCTPTLCFSPYSLFSFSFGGFFLVR